MLRRELLAGVGAAASLALFSQRAGAQDCPNINVRHDRDVLIQIFLRGGADALNLCVPYGDDDYLPLRRSDQGLFDIAIDAPLQLGDDYFALHPKFQSLIDSGCWSAGDLAFVVGAGTPDGRRSHFANEDRIEYANGLERATDGGWMARYLRAAPSVTSTPFARALALQPYAPSALFGSTSVVTTRRLAELAFDVDDQTAYAEALRQLHARAQTPVEKLGARTGEVMDAVGCKNLLEVTHNGVSYPDTVLGSQLAEAAKVVKAVPEIELITLDYGGWDTHGDQLARHDVLVGDLSDALAALYRDLSLQSGRGHIGNVTVMVQSEFGRRLQANGSHGTDHGSGGLMLLLGGGVKGGFHTQNWSRGKHSLLGEMEENGDLKVTTDYRSVLVQLLERRLRLSLSLDEWERMFPGFGFQPGGLDLFAPRG